MFLNFNVFSELIEKINPKNLILNYFYMNSPPTTTI